MSRPGDRLRNWASRMFDSETMERLIDPIVADLQMEYAEASRTGRIWRRRWVRVAGYAAFLNIATRPLRVFVALTFAFTALSALPAILRTDVKVSGVRALYLIPPALVLAVPMALTLAIAWAGRSTRQSLRAMITAGVFCSIFVFATLGWLVPSANQAFRVSIAREAGWRRDPVRNSSEKTIGELRQEIASTTTFRPDWEALQFDYYNRWAFPCASLALALLMVALQQRGASRRFMLFAGVPVIFGYYVLMFVSREYAILRYAVSPAAGAWLPNVVVMLTATVMLAFGTRSPQTAP